MLEQCFRLFIKINLMASTQHDFIMLNLIVQMMCRPMLVYFLPYPPAWKQFKVMPLAKSNPC